MDIQQIKTVGCYVRVSTDNQLENYSIEEQTERLKAYCKAKNWNIYKIYTDGGYSGGNTDRPALNQMLNDIHNHKIDMVVVYKLDRLSRSQKDTLTLIEDEFLANSTDFVSVSENFDTSTPFGRAMIGILSVFAQLEKDQITERFTMGRIGRSKAGYYHGGAFAPTGYRYINGELIVDAYTAEQVNEVYNRFLSGYSINSISEHMHKKYGGWTNHTHVLYVLKNSVYIGKVKFKNMEYEGLHQPIIDKETFYNVQKLLNSKEKTESKIAMQKTPFRANYLLSSLIYCKKCGARYSVVHGFYKCYSRSKSNKKYIKDCACTNKNWPVEELDSIIISEINKLKDDKHYIDNILNKTLFKKIEETPLKIRLKEIDNQISKMLNLYQFNNISAEQISIKINDLQNEKEMISRKLSAPKGEQAKMKPINLISNDIFENGELEEKRMLVSNLIQSIILDDDTIYINWRI